ncbi:hypothetical protein BJX70DRAFT_407526 [Aspergillus crustosus]
MSNASNVVLSLPGCTAECGAGASFYDDVGPRLSTWLIPIILLIGNMHMARLGNEKYAALLHFLGDPIDTMWSLLTKAETWSRCFSLAQRTIPQAPNETHEHFNQRVIDIATIYAVIEELDSSGTAKFKDHFDRILADKREDMTIDHFYHLSSPGGRIGSPMFISWLIPAVLFSNALGGFTSRRTCLRILERFVKTATHNALEDRQLFSHHKQILSPAQPDLLHRLLQRPAMGRRNLLLPAPKDPLQRRQPRLSTHWPSSFFRSSPSQSQPPPSVALLWATPTTGLNCRSLMLICIAILWLLSAAGSNASSLFLSAVFLEAVLAPVDILYPARHSLTSSWMGSVAGG